MYCETIPQDNGENLSSLMEMDTLLIGLECAAEKGRYQATEVFDMVSSQKSDAMKLYEYDKVRIMSDISLDYAVEIDEELEKLRKQFNVLFDEIRGAYIYDSAEEKMPLNQKPRKLEKEFSKNDGPAYRNAIKQLIDDCEDLEYIVAVYSFASAYPKQEKR